MVQREAALLQGIIRRSIRRLGSVSTCGVIVRDCLVKGCSLFVPVQPLGRHPVLGAIGGNNSHISASTPHPYSWSIYNRGKQLNSISLCIATRLLTFFFGSVQHVVNDSSDQWHPE